MFWKKFIIFVIDSLIHVFAWKKYPERGAEGQNIVLRRVLWITPPKPTLDFKMIVEEARLIVFLSQVQFLHDKLLIFSIKYYITMFWKPSKYALWFFSIQHMMIMVMMVMMFHQFSAEIWIPCYQNKICMITFAIIRLTNHLFTNWL